MATSDRPVVDQSYQVALNIAFKDKATQDAYQVHEDHVKFVEEIFKESARRSWFTTSKDEAKRSFLHKLTETRTQQLLPLGFFGTPHSPKSTDEKQTLPLEAKRPLQIHDGLSWVESD